MNQRHAITIPKKAEVAAMQKQIYFFDKQTNKNKQTNNADSIANGKEGKE
jgi:hypothetical protein